VKLKLNLIFQGAAGVIQFANANGSMVPPKYQWLLAILVGAAQLVVSVQAHYSNPDGTNASVAYRPGDKTAQ